MNFLSVYSKLTTIGLILVGLVGCSQSTSFHTGTSETDMPNIIVILADDAGYVDFGFIPG